MGGAWNKKQTSFKRDGNKERGQQGAQEMLLSVVPGNAVCGTQKREHSHFWVCEGAALPSSMAEVAGANTFGMWYNMRQLPISAEGARKTHRPMHCLLCSVL